MLNTDPLALIACIYFFKFYFNTNSNHYCFEIFIGLFLIVYRLDINILNPIYISCSTKINKYKLLAKNINVNILVRI